MCCPTSFNGVCGTISGGCRNIGTEPCCPSGSQNDVADTCCWGVQAGTATKTDNDNCCPSTQVVAYTLGGAGSVGKYCCPTNVGGSSAVVVPDGKGGFTCCPSANVLRDENNVLHCCPTAIDAANTRWRPQFDPQNPTSTSGTNVCCPVAQLNTPTDDVCCPATGGPYSTSTETKCWCVAALCMLRKSLPVLCAVLFGVWLRTLIYSLSFLRRCSAGVPTTQAATGYVACCPAANMVVVDDGTFSTPPVVRGRSVWVCDSRLFVRALLLAFVRASLSNSASARCAQRECCPSARVVNDGAGAICCPDDRWDATAGTCCAADARIIDATDGSFSACCPVLNLTASLEVCCLPAWLDGVAVALDNTRDCCPVSVQAATGSCCPATEKDYRGGVCCPNTDLGQVIRSQRRCSEPFVLLGWQGLRWLLFAYSAGCRSGVHYGLCGHVLPDRRARLQ